MNYPWSVLNLDEPTSDTRCIRRAYAALLKRNRPDDDAQAFQTLHDAYKLAMQLAEAQPPDHSSSNVATDGPQGHGGSGSALALAIAPGIEIAGGAALAGQETDRQSSDEEFQQVASRLREVLSTADRVWTESTLAFLENSAVRYDLRYHFPLALQAVRAICGSGTGRKIPTRIIVQLDGMLDFIGQINELETASSPVAVGEALQRLPAYRALARERKRTRRKLARPTEYAGFGRCLAGVLDLVPLAIMSQFMPDMLALTLTLTVRMVAEVSPLRASLGKFVCGLVVTQHDGRPAGPYQRMARLAGWCIFFFPIYGSHQFGDHLFGDTAFLFLLMWLISNWMTNGFTIMAHDWVTRTRVMVRVR